MPTKTRRKPDYPPDIEVVVYPDDVLERLEAEAEIASIQLKRGELTSVDDFARELGIDFRK